MRNRLLTLGAVWFHALKCCSTASLQTYQRHVHLQLHTGTNNIALQTTTHTLPSLCSRNRLFLGIGISKEGGTSSVVLDTHLTSADAPAQVARFQCFWQRHSELVIAFYCSHPETAKKRQVHISWTPCCVQMIALCINICYQHYSSSVCEYIPCNVIMYCQ